ncbi:MAG TPA: NnrU family protein [Bauldia sp.]|nr:NnrU family protein [Bauldia sp.]
MAILVLGLVVFLGMHTFRIVAPSGRDALIARLGEGPFKGLYSVVALIGFVLVAWGFSLASADYVQVYLPPPGLRHVTMGLMLVALVLAVASALPPGRIARFARHPLLVGTILWACGHLFVNGDLAGVVLFGAFLAWAAIDLVAQSRRPRSPAVPLSGASDVLAILIGGVLYALLVWRLHAWLFGVSPVA